MEIHVRMTTTPDTDPMRNAHALYLLLYALGPAFADRLPGPVVLGYYRTGDNEPSGQRTATAEDVECLNQALTAIKLGQPVTWGLPDSVRIDVGPGIDAPEDRAALALAHHDRENHAEPSAFDRFVERVRSMLGTTLTTEILAS